MATYIVRSKPRQRAVRGSVGARLLLRIPENLDGLVRTAAKEDGVTLAEWWRAAAIAATLMRVQERSKWVGLLERQRGPTEQPIAPAPAKSARRATS